MPCPTLRPSAPSREGSDRRTRERMPRMRCGKPPSQRQQFPAPPSRSDAALRRRAKPPSPTPRASRSAQVLGARRAAARPSQRRAHPEARRCRETSRFWPRNRVLARKPWARSRRSVGDLGFLWLKPPQASKSEGKRPPRVPERGFVAINRPSSCMEQRKSRRRQRLRESRPPQEGKRGKGGGAEHHRIATEECASDATSQQERASAPSRCAHQITPLAQSPSRLHLHLRLRKREQSEAGQRERRKGERMDASRETSVAASLRHAADAASSG